jgi:fructoselysine-6-P-deglycase FrlB-like protein
MSGERTRAEMAEQPEVLRRLAERFDDQVATVRAQQLAVALADARGLDADAPAGLTKVTPTQ